MRRHPAFIRLMLWAMSLAFAVPTVESFGAATVIPAPTLEFTLGTSLIEPGESVTISWQSKNTRTCAVPATSAAVSGWSGSQPLAGSVVLSFATPGRRVLRLGCTGVVGRVARSQTIAVFAKPKILSFLAQPAIVRSSRTSVLSWQIRDAISCTGSGAWKKTFQSKDRSQGVFTTPLLARGTHEFKLTCRSSGGEVTETVRVEALDPPRLTLSADRSLLRVGDAVTLDWQTIDATGCTASQAWSGRREVRGRETLELREAGVHRFELECERQQPNVSVRQSVAVEAVPVSISVAPNTLDFGRVIKGERGATRWVHIRNPSQLGVKLLTVTIIGDAKDFVADDGVEACGVQIAPLGLCSIRVSFVPQRTSRRATTLRILTDASPTPVDIPLAGDGIERPTVSGLTASVERIDFGSTAVAAFSATRTVRLENPTDAPVDGVRILLAGDDAEEFALASPACPSVLAAGKSCDIALQLRGRRIGRKTGQLRIVTAVNELQVGLRGRVGESENQFLCRASPMPTDPVPAAAWDVGISSVENSTDLLIRYSPNPPHTSAVLRLYPQGRSAPAVSFEPAVRCATTRVRFVSGASYGMTERGCDVDVAGVFTAGKSIAEITLSEGKRFVTDAVTLGTIKPARPVLWGSAAAGEVRLEWLPNATAPVVTGYDILRLEKGLPVLVRSVPADTRSHRVDGLTNGVRQQWAIRAKSAGGASLLSAPVSLTPRSSPSTTVQIEDIRVNQAVEVVAGSATPLIAGKPGIVEVTVRVTGDEIGMPARIRLSAPGRESIEIFGPLLDSSGTGGDSTACTATFDLREDAASWFTEGPVELTAEVELPDSGGATVAAASRPFAFVAERPLYVKLIPVNSARGNPTAAEIELAKTSIEQQLRAMYPNRTPQVVLAAAPFQFKRPSTDRNFPFELLPQINALRSAELNNRNCDRFYYALHRDNATLVSRAVGVALVPDGPAPGTCPSLTGVGIIEAVRVAEIAAHEIGHNHGRLHVRSHLPLAETNDRCAPISQTDSAYPHARGRIGIAGYDAVTHRKLSPTLFHDIMSYCSRTWISDYQYRALRAFQDGLATLESGASRAAGGARVAGDGGGRLFEGTIDAAGVWTLQTRLVLDGSREAAANAGRGYTAVARLGTGAEHRLPLEVAAVDHAASQVFWVWLPDTIDAKEIIVRSAAGAVVLRIAMEESSSRTAKSMTGFYRVSGNTLELLPWSDGARMLVRIRDGERVFVGNDEGVDMLRTAFIAGDIFEVIGTAGGRRLRIANLSASADIVPQAAEVPLAPSSPAAAPSTLVRMQERTPLVGNLVTDLAPASGLAATNAGSVIEVAAQSDPLTGSRYVLARSADAGPSGYLWSLGYRSASEELLNQRSLGSTIAVLWRTAANEARALPSIGWVVFCANEVWTVRDGYRLLVSKSDPVLIEHREYGMEIVDAATAKVVESVSCRGPRGVRVAGYALDIAADSPALSADAVSARRFVVDLDGAGGIVGLTIGQGSFDLGHYCQIPGSVLHQDFCTTASGN